MLEFYYYLFFGLENKYMLLVSWVVRIVKNSGWGFENVGRDRRLIVRVVFFWLIIDRSVKRAKDCWLSLICL